MTLAQTVQTADWPRDERRLYATLAADPQRVFTKENLLAEVYPGDSSASVRRLDALAARVRQRVMDTTGERAIANIWGVGYRYAA